MNKGGSSSSSSSSSSHSHHSKNKLQSPVSLESTDKPPPQPLATEGTQLEEEEEGETLEVAEQALVRVAEILLTHNLTVKEAFANQVVNEEVEDNEVVQLLTQDGLLEGLADLGFKFYDQVELACVFRVLCKPEIGNTILVEDLEQIINNIIQEYGEPDPNEDGTFPAPAEPQQQDYLNPLVKGGPGGDDSDAESVASNASSKAGSGNPKIRKKIDEMDKKTLQIMFKLALKLQKTHYTVAEMVKGRTVNQLIRTKKRETTVQLIKYDDFVNLLIKHDVIKKPTKLAGLTKALCLSKKLQD